MNFTAEDFEGPGCHCYWKDPCDCVPWPSEEIAEAANAKLKQMLDAAPTVFNWS